MDSTPQQLVQCLLIPGGYLNTQSWTSHAQVWIKTFLIGTGLLQILQAVIDLGLMTFGEFEAFVAALGKPADVESLQFDGFLGLLKGEADSVLLKMDDLKDIKFETTWNTLADLDRMQFTREGLSDAAKKRPIIKYLLDRI